MPLGVIYHKKAKYFNQNETIFSLEISYKISFAKSDHIYPYLSVILIFVIVFRYVVYSPGPPFTNMV